MVKRFSFFCDNNKKKQKIAANDSQFNEKMIAPHLRVFLCDNMRFEPKIIKKKEKNSSEKDT